LDAEEVSRSATPLSVEPHGIDFGCLKPREGANATLRVNGGPGQVIVHNDRLRVTPPKFGQESTELQLILLGGSAGELIWDDIVLQGDNDELKVLVTARWEHTIAPKPKFERKLTWEPEPGLEPVAVPKSVPINKLPAEEKETQTMKPEVSRDEAEKRTFKGKTCRWCGKNIRYDGDSQSWKPCKTCRGARIPIAVLLRISKEFYLGLKEVHSSMAEIWDTLLGKEEKRR
jgi:hypothetical protein